MEYYSVLTYILDTSFPSNIVALRADGSDSGCIPFKWRVLSLMVFSLSCLMEGWNHLEVSLVLSTSLITPKVGHSPSMYRLIWKESRHWEDPVQEKEDKVWLVQLTDGRRGKPFSSPLLSYLCVSSSWVLRTHFGICLSVFFCFFSPFIPILFYICEDFLKGSDSQQGHLLIHYIYLQFSFLHMPL